MIMHKPIFQYRKMKAGYSSVTQYLSTPNKNRKQSWKCYKWRSTIFTVL